MAYFAFFDNIGWEVLNSDLKITHLTLNR